MKSIDINGATGLSPAAKWTISGIIVGAGAGLGIGLYEANKSTPSSSR